MSHAFPPAYKGLSLTVHGIKSIISSWFKIVYIKGGKHGFFKFAGKNAEATLAGVAEADAKRATKNLINDTIDRVNDECGTDFEHIRTYFCKNPSTHKDCEVEATYDLIFLAPEP